MAEKEKYNIYNSLAILLKVVEGEKTTVDLRNEASVYGIIEQSDGYMNVLMRDCIFTDARGGKFSYDRLFIQARNIRYVHVPPNIPIIPAIIAELSNMGKRKPREASKPTFKMKRTLQNQREGKLATDLIMQNRLMKKQEEDNNQPGASGSR